MVPTYFFDLSKLVLLPPPLPKLEDQAILWHTADQQAVLVGKFSITATGVPYVELAEKCWQPEALSAKPNPEGNPPVYELDSCGNIYFYAPENQTPFGNRTLSDQKRGQMYTLSRLDIVPSSSAPPPITGLSIQDSSSGTYNDINVILTFPSASVKKQVDGDAYIISLSQDYFPTLEFQSVSKPQSAILQDLFDASLSATPSGGAYVVTEGRGCDKVYGVKAVRKTTTGTVRLDQTLRISSPSLGSTGYTYGYFQLDIEYSSPTLGTETFTIVASPTAVSKLRQYTFLTEDTPTST